MAGRSQERKREHYGKDSAGETHYPAPQPPPPPPEPDPE